MTRVPLCLLLILAAPCGFGAPPGVQTFPLLDRDTLPQPASGHPGADEPVAPRGSREPAPVPQSHSAPIKDDRPLPPVAVEARVPSVPVPATEGVLAPPPPPPPAAGYATEPESPGPGSAAILHACWTPEQLAGTPADKAIQRHLRPDLAPPPDWAIREAETALAPLAPGLRGSIRAVEPADPQARLIALTFDLCEQANERAGYDAAVVNALRAAGVKATFFAGGKWLRTHPEQAMQLMADPRFEVGNHAWTHGNLRVLEGGAARDQILWTQAEYQVLHRELAGRPCAQSAGPDAWRQVPAWPAVFRFPYGTCNQASLDAVAGLGLAAIQWSLVTADPDKGRSAEAIARTVLAGVKRSRGTIIVAHANGRGVNTAKALALFLPTLQQQGYRFVTASELLATGRPVAVQECYEVRPGDNRRYDALFGRGTGG
ncbi:MAG TPA: polysaccharide deacetylase family protein [Lamprocystis sp. (in: g-proteobacteria)]|nr:polysaccharide deacetylase family protein [Lamprocystis sp. (in: g-proteobacteria)]